MTLTTENPYSARCFREYGVVTDDSGRYTALYRPAHLIGLELGISVASVALRGEPTGSAQDFTGDVVATAKKDLHPGTSWTEKAALPSTEPSCRPANPSLPGISPSDSPIRSRMKRAVAAGERVKWADVAYDSHDETVKFRLEMEAIFKEEWSV